MAHGEGLPKGDWGFPFLSAGEHAAPRPVAGEPSIRDRVIPGVSRLGELVSKGSDLAAIDEVDYRTRPDQLLKSVGVPEEEVDRDFADLQEQQQAVLASGDTVELFRRFLHRFATAYRLEVHRAWTQSAFLSFVELHCPEGEGSMAAFQSLAEGSAEASFDLKVLGAGGGSGRLVRISLSPALEARDGRCYSVQLPVEFRVEECSYRGRQGTSKPARFSRVTPVAVLQGLRQLPLAPFCPHCCRQRREIAERADLRIIPYDLVGAEPDEAAAVEIEVASGSTARSMMSLNLTALASTIEVAGEVTTSRSIKYQYRLPGGRRYYAFGPVQHPFVYWLTET